jgi:hypothetical protein
LLFLLLTGSPNRIIIKDRYGRTKLQRVREKEGLRYLHIFYSSRALEWLNIRKILREVLDHFGLSEQVSLEYIAISWTYDSNLAAKCYKPSIVFKHFSFINLLHQESTCACHTAARLQPFLDPLTKSECSDFCKPSLHVRSMDMNIIQHPQLRSALSQGLNHIPLHSTDFRGAVNAAVDALAQLYTIFNLQDYELDFEAASAFTSKICIEKLRAASHSNKFGFKTSSPALFSIPAVSNELNWLLSHLFISGLDKAANNASFMCIRHIRLQAYQRLMGPDFSPYMTKKTWSLPTAIFDTVKLELIQLLPEAQPSYNALPFLMASYKQHKHTYRWLTNAAHTVYTNIASLLTVATLTVFDSFKKWAKKTDTGYQSFLQVNTSSFWVIDSVMDVTLNLPKELYDIYVADITKCYESIPLEGQDNLLEGMKFMLRIGFREASVSHPKAGNSLWVKINDEGTTTAARWSTTLPKGRNWLLMPHERLLTLHSWLMSHCFVSLGDRVWRQIKGIPMGFSCSPLWCNIYLMTYEVRFIQRLARLGRKDLLSKFQYTFRYIDDICWLNVGEPQNFLSPSQPQTFDNPYWIYPLQVLEIKPEINTYATDNPLRGISAHFMNVQFDLDVVQPHLYSLKKYDKRRALPFKFTQFIKFHSNRPIRQCYNIIIGQVLPILYISNNAIFAVQEILLLIDTLVANGFQEKRLRKSILDWLAVGQFPASLVDIDQVRNLLSY